jgi:hypothetical protein
MVASRPCGGPPRLHPQGRSSRRRTGIEPASAAVQRSPVLKSVPSGERQRSRPSLPQSAQLSEGQRGKAAKPGARPRNPVRANRVPTRRDLVGLHGGGHDLVCQRQPRSNLSRGKCANRRPACFPDGEVRGSRSFRSGRSGRLEDQRQSGACRAGTLRFLPAGRLPVSYHCRAGNLRCLQLRIRSPPPTARKSSPTKIGELGSPSSSATAGPCRPMTGTRSARWLSGGRQAGL